MSQPSVQTSEPPKAAAWPLIDRLSPFRGGVSRLEQRWSRYGDVFKVPLVRGSAIVFMHPSAMREVLVHKRDNFVRGPSFGLVRRLTGASLLTLEGADWRKRRRTMQPAFQRQAIDALVQSMSEVTDVSLRALRERAPSGAVVDAHREMLNLTIDVAGQALLGRSMSTQSAGPFTRAYAELCRKGQTGIGLPEWLPTRGNRRLRSALEELNVGAYALIVATKRRDSEPGATPTLLSTLLATRDAETGEPLGYRELRDEVVTLLFAGHETTSLMMTWAFTYLGRHPEVVRKMREEVDRVLGDRPPTMSDLSKLVYLSQVVREVLRLRPPTWMIPRDVLADAEVQGRRVRRGDLVMLMPYFMHRHPEFWTSPERFDPDRFATPQAAAAEAFFPFSIGPHTCIGAAFTMTEAQVVLAMWLQRVDFELLSQETNVPHTLITLHPSRPVRMKLRWRA